MTGLGEGPAPVAIVTGGAQRIGRAIVLALVRQGWSVGVHYRRSIDEASDLVGEIARSGGRAMAIAADLSREAEVASLLPAVAEALGPVSLLVNNASQFDYDSVTSASRDSWDRHMETNLRAPFVLIQAMARQLPDGTPGNVVNLLDERVWSLTPHFVSYTASKAALWALTQSLALALAPRIRVNGIGPGPTLPSPRQSREQFERQAASMPLGHGTTPEEIARTVLYILSVQSMTGQMIALDGGQHLGYAQPTRTELSMNLGDE